jgi:hypothetical protein
LGTVVDAKEFHDLTLNLIDDNVGNPGKTSSRLLESARCDLDQETYSAWHSRGKGLCHLGGHSWIVWLNVPQDIVKHNIEKIVGGGSSPAEAHQGSKISFSFLPTSSCSTNYWRAAAASPRLTASTK